METLNDTRTSDRERRMASAGDVDEMLELNRVQKEFYESRYAALEAKSDDEAAANIITNQWTKLRRKIQGYREQVGIAEHVYSLHKSWMGDLSEKSVLDLGCFDGNHLTMYLVSNAREYVGIDLSELAIRNLESKIEAYPTARAVAGDFLKNDFPDESFDLIYAHSVLHHFRSLTPVLAEIKRILKPGGRIITFDPLQTEPANFILRSLYRPFQSDRAWEYPFSRRTLRLLGDNFDVRAVQGVQGLAKTGYPFMAIPGLGRVGRFLSTKGLELDNRYATKLTGLTLACWQITLMLEKTEQPLSA